MEKTQSEVIKTALSQNIFDKANDENLSIVKAFSRMCNCYGGDFNEITDEIVKDKTVFYNFAILAASCGILMGYTWECDERHSCAPHWDARKQASEEFCHKNMETFQEIFGLLSGFIFPMKENIQYRRFLDDCDVINSPLKRHSALYTELMHFEMEHSTLKQKMMGLFCRILAKGGIHTELFSDVRFPFI